MKKISLGIVFCLLSFQSIIAQNNIPRLRISVVTCAPGDELYTTFGHSAIRVTDSATQTDLAFNYGMFDFNDPDFYTKFASGKLDYFLAAFSFSDFMEEYRSEHRDVTEQVLDLSDSMKTNLVKALYINLQGAAKYYRYDFLYDNCTTRIRDLLVKYGGMKVNRPVVPANTTYRDMLHEYLDRGDQSWSKLGIDILLAMPADRKVNIESSMFLPDYLLKGIDSASPAIVLKKQYANKGNTAVEKNTNWPFYIFSSVALLFILLSLSKNKNSTRLVRALDFILFFFTGLLGVLLLLLWLGSDHEQYRNNLNVIWALPTHLIAAFFIWKKPRWLQNYFSICTVIYLLLLASWFWLPQEFNYALIPLVILLLQRCLQRRKK